MQHAPSIGFNDSKMVREITENSNMVGVGCKKSFQDSSTHVVKEFSHSNWIRCRYSLSYGSVRSCEYITGIFDTSQGNNQGTSQVRGVDCDPKCRHSVADY